MAGAYARITGRLGVCIAGKGCGMANALSGIAVENAEGHRVLLISSSAGKDGPYNPSKGGYRYFPQREAVRPITKWSGAVSNAEDIRNVMCTAFRMSHTGRPGVVHVDVPEHIVNLQFPYDPAWIRDPATYRSLDAMAPDRLLVEEAADLLTRAKFPLIHAGTGIIHARAHEELMALAAFLEAPVSTSWGARSAMDERREQSIPMIYLATTTELRNAADVVLALGSRMGETDWWGKPPYWAPPSRQKLIQVDLDRAVFGFNKPVDLPVLGDVKVFMKQLLETLKNRKEAMNLEERREKTEEFRRSCRARRDQLNKHLMDSGVPMAPAHVPHTCQKIFDDDAIVVFDGGNTCIWGLFFHQVKIPNTIVGTPKMGHLGAGVSQALGAQAADPTRQVYCIIGDGAMGFHQQEIETAVRYNLAGHIPGPLRQAVGHGENEPVVHPQTHQDPYSENPESRGIHQHGHRRDPIRSTGGGHGRLRSARGRPQGPGGCHPGRKGLGTVLRHSHRRQPRKTHVGAEPQGFQGPACGTGRIGRTMNLTEKKQMTTQPQKEAAKTPPKTVLVTGASGYLGKHLIRKLASNPDGIKHIIAADIREPSPGEQGGKNHLCEGGCEVP